MGEDQKLIIKTTGYDWQKSASDQEIARTAQALRVSNPSTLKERLQPAVKAFKKKIR